jgi:transposase
MLMKTRAGKSRDPVKEQFWRRTIAHHSRSGLSIRTFCQREGLETANFHWWRRALDRRDREVAPPPKLGRPNPTTERPPAPSAFLPVRVVPDAAKPMTATAPIEIVMPAGPTVRVMRGFDPIALDAVLSVLEDRRC